MPLPDDRQVTNPQVQTNPAGIPPAETPMPADQPYNVAPDNKEVRNQPSAPAFDEQGLREREERLTQREDAMKRNMGRRRELHAAELSDKDVESQVVGTYSASAWDMMNTQPNITPEAERAMRSTTIVLLITRNGFPIVGTSTAAAPEGYNHSDGLKWAKEDAMSKLWTMEEYSHRNRIMGLEPLPDDVIDPPATGDIAEPWPPRRAVA